MLYCGKCGLPCEYCEWSPKAFDQEECKKWLKTADPKLFDKLYPSQEKVEGEEESKEEPKKKKKKTVTIKVEKAIRVIKLKRGGKKTITNLIGFELFGCNL